MFSEKMQGCFTTFSNPVFYVVFIVVVFTVLTNSSVQAGTNGVNPIGETDYSKILEIADQDKYTDPEKVLENLKSIRIELEQKGLYEYWPKYASIIFDIHYQRNTAGEALGILTEILERHGRRLKKEQRFKIEVFIAVLHYNLGESEKAMAIYERIEPEVADSVTLASIYGNRANILSDRGNYEDALDNYIKAERILSSGDNTEKLINVKNNIGLIYRHIKDYDNAINMLVGASSLLPAAKNPNLAVMVYGNLGIFYKEKGDSEMAVRYYQEALDLAVKLKNPFHEAQMLMNIGNIYKERGMVEEALGNYRESLSISYAHDILYGIILNYLNIGNAEKSRRNFSAALAAYDSANVRLVGQQLPKELRELYLGYSDLYEEMDNPGQALIYYKKCNQLSEELFNTERDKAIYDLKIRYETEVKDQQLTLVSLRENQQRAKIRLYTVVFSSIVFILLLVIFYFRYRNRYIRLVYERNLELIRNPFAVGIVQEKQSGDSPQDNSVYEKLLEAMQENGLYRDPDLRISDLAKKLGVEDKVLSQSIQDKSGMNFRQFLGYFRISQARRMLLEGGADSRINEVMYDCGFSSRTAFHNAFTKYTGMSPSEFKKQSAKEPDFN